ncbi:MAG: hypothetical protein IRY85_18780 [Micromonosporaceae bacterium]|nr:hypothetical protein [Micromonosporaceae bacterium]
MVVPTSLRGKVFSARYAIGAGLVTPDHLRSRAWQRVFRGIYADASLTVTHQLRCAAALAFLAPPGAAVAGRSAARLHGVMLGTADDPVELLVPPLAPRCRQGGVAVHHGVLGTADRVVVERLPVTSPARTCWDLVSWLDPVEAVVWIDRLLALGRVTTAELSDWLARHRAAATRGVRRFERALSLVDARSESPAESRLRVRLALAGLRPPAVQYEIYDADGRFVARVDLAWPERKVAVEYDGVWHVGSAAQIHAERRRLSALASCGWSVLVATSDRLRDDFAGFTAELRAALRTR